MRIQGLCLALILVSANIFCVSWLTKHAVNGDRRLNYQLRKTVVFIADLPSHFKSLIGHYSQYVFPEGSPDSYSELKVDGNFSSSDGGYLLRSYNLSSGEWLVDLFNLSSKKITPLISGQDVKADGPVSDVVEFSAPNRLAAIPARYRFWSPVCWGDGLLTFIVPLNDMVTIDLKSKKELWRVRGAFHHSLEVDSDGNFLSISSSSFRQGHLNIASYVDSGIDYEDNVVVKVSPKGRILETISISDLLTHSDLEYLLFGSSNPNNNSDPIHANQVTPISVDGDYWKSGDILISLRNLSTVLIVDPKSRIVKWSRSGPWMNQHCIFPIGKSKMSILDNHSFASGFYWLDKKWKSRFLIHTVGNGSTESLNMTKNGGIDFRIPLEGRFQVIGLDKYYLEDCAKGTIFIYKSGSLIFKWGNCFPDGSFGKTGWCRYSDESTGDVFLSKMASSDMTAE